MGWIDNFSFPLLHLLFLASVFDIYFKSPIVSVPEPKPPDFEAPARRLVLFVADGLRAHSFYEPSAAPNLHHHGLVDGVMGISHTRVPTESRPGHVALLAGLYEDPSAITKGWKENPVEFDSVLNRSRQAWAWGSPDILPMFARGAAKGHVTTSMYRPELENFSAGDPSALDLWVFDKVEKMFDKAKDDVELQLALRQDGVVFFLHLLGLDTNGHTNKPHSSQYKRNIKTVDEGVDRIVEVVERYYRNDERTAFVFTADHGMTDWGSHGTGMDHETATPLVAWGAGVRKPRPPPRALPCTGTSSCEETMSTKFWKMFPIFDQVEKVDVRQADLAPFMSTLLGIIIPVNNAGTLPIDLLDIHPSQKVSAMIAQCEQMLAQYKALREKHEKVHLPAIFHVPFSLLTDDKILNEMKVIRSLDKKGHPGESLTRSHKFLSQIIEGISYYQRYQRFQLFSLISLSFLGCAALNISTIIRRFTHYGINNQSEQKKKKINLISAGLALLAIFCSLAQKLPYHFLLYYTAPVYVWTRVAYQVDEIRIKRMLQESCTKQTAMTIVLVAVVLEILVVSFFERKALTIGLALLCGYPAFFNNISKKHWGVWVLCCASLAIFPLLPPIDGRLENIDMVLLSGLLTSAFSFLLMPSLNFVRSIISPFPFLAAVCVFYTGRSDGLALPIQAISWIILISSIPISLCSSPIAFSRLFCLSLALTSSYLLLSLSYESFLLPILLISMAAWVLLEASSSPVHDLETEEGGVGSDCHLTLSRSQTIWSNYNMRQHVRYKNVVTYRDFVCVLVFLFITVLSFFSTGNIASLNSFDPSAIRCFVAVFDPFLMGGLLLVKILIPFLGVATFFALIVKIRGLRSSVVFSIVQLFCDILALQFFFLVKDSGSWLDIGTSLSHYVIVEGTSIFIIILLKLATVFTTTQIPVFKMSS